MIASTLYGGGRQFDQTAFTPLAWVAESGRLSLALAGAIAVLGLQYFWRKTMPSRWITGSVCLLGLFTQFVPWKAAFAIERRLSPAPGVDGGVSMSFEPGLGRFQSPAGANFKNFDQRNRVSENDTVIYLPVDATGLPPETVLKADRSDVRLTASDSKSIDVGVGERLEIRNDGLGDGRRTAHHGIRVRGDLYGRIKDQPVTLQIDYSFTLFRLAHAYGMPALSGDQRMPGLGWCATKVNNAGAAIVFACMEAGASPSCITLFLEHAPSGRRNPAFFACPGDYAPYFGQYIPDAMRRYGRNIPFLDQTGLAHYPVEGRQIPESRVVARLYDPQDHFTRTLTIPNIRLRDWEAE
jgi:hypothetical protein